jgi:hypothetical protein
MQFDNTTPLIGGGITADAYKQLAKEQGISRGSTLAVSLPQVLPGYMVGRSTLHGAVRGWRSDAIASEINVDPDIPGEGFTVDMTKISAQDFSAATDRAALNDAVSYDDLASRASAVYRAFAPVYQRPEPQNGEDMGDTTRALDMPAAAPLNQYNAQPARAAFPAPAPPPPQPVAQALAPAPATIQATPPAPPPQAPAPQPVATPKRASLFAQTVASATPRPAVTPPTVSGAATPPTFKVEFEIDGMPFVQESWYHDVVRNEHVLVLVYDNRCVGYPRNRLQPTEQDIAVHVADSDSIYIVRDPSISFEFADQDFKVLLIKAEHPYSAAPQPEVMA